MNQQRLASLRNPTCDLCGLCAEASTVWVPGRGNPEAEILILGEAPGWEEDREGKPFVGKSGKLLSKLLGQAGLSEESDVYITNTVKCFPRQSKTPGPEHIVACAKYLSEEIDILRPKVILTLGKVAASTLLNVQAMGKARGRVHYLEADAGTSKIQIPVVPSWHPAYILRGNAGAEVELFNDILLARGLARPQEDTRDYRWIESPEQLTGLVDELLDLHATNGLPYGAIAVDVETNDPIGPDFSPRPFSPQTTLVSVQVAWDAGRAALIPVVYQDSAFADPITIQFLKAELERLFTLPVIGHNFKFDYIVLYTKLGIRVPNVVFDTMLGNHALFMGSKPNGLSDLEMHFLHQVTHKDEVTQFLNNIKDKTERRMSNVPRALLLKYGCGDADNTLRIYPLIVEELKKRTYQEFPESYRPIFRNGLASFEFCYRFPWRAIADLEISGAKVDMERLPHVKQSMEEEMAGYLNVVRSSEFFPRVQDLRKQPNPKKQVEVKQFQKFVHCNACGEEAPWPAVEKPSQCSACKSSDVVLKRKKVGTGEFRINEEEPDFVYPEFLVSSPKQLKLLLFESMCLPDPNAGSTDKDTLDYLTEYCVGEGLHKHLEVLQAIMAWRKVSKLYSSYVRTLEESIQRRRDEISPYPTASVEPEIEPELTHPDYLFHGTKTGRFSSAFHTIPRKSVIKELYVSRFPDGFICNADYSQVEVRVFSVIANDPGLKSVFQGGRDPYKFGASRIHGVPEDRVTPEQRQDAKDVILGLLYERGPNAIAAAKGIYLEQAQKLIDDFLRASPNVRQFFKDQHAFVRTYKCVLTKFGRIRPFFDELDSGDEALIAHAERAASNTPVQSLASDLCANSLGRLSPRIAARNMRTKIFGFTHDSILADVPGEDLLDYLSYAKEEMEDRLVRLFPWLDVPIKAEMDIGLNWRHQIEARVTAERHLWLKGEASLFQGVTERLKKCWTVKVVSSRLLPHDQGQSPQLEVTLELKRK